jgi:transcriptional regulator of acetoin/glycerol metabolism
VTTTPAADDRNNDAQALFDQGVELMKTKQYTAACPMLRESLRLEAMTGTAFNLARCEKMRAPWPHNVREHEAVLRQVRDLTDAERVELWAVEQVVGSHTGVTGHGALTSRAIREALEASGGNRTRAAEMLGVTHGRLLRMLKALAT